MKEDWKNLLDMAARIRDGGHQIEPEDVKKMFGKAGLAAVEGALEYILDEVRTAKSDGQETHAKADVIINHGNDEDRINIDDDVEDAEIIDQKKNPIIIEVD